MRYTVVYRVIAILLSVLMLLGSTSVLAESSNVEPASEVSGITDTNNDPTLDPPEGDDSDSEEPTDEDDPVDPDDPDGPDDPDDPKEPSDKDEPDDKDDDSDPPDKDDETDDDEDESDDEEESSDEDLLELEELMLEATEYNLTVYRTGGAGTMTYYGGNIAPSQIAPATIRLPEGTEVDFTASPGFNLSVRWNISPSTGFSFHTGGMDGDREATVIMTGNMTVFAHFMPIEVPLYLASGVTAMTGVTSVASGGLVMAGAGVNFEDLSEIPDDRFPLWVYYQATSTGQKILNTRTLFQTSTETTASFSMPGYENGVFVERDLVPGRTVSWSIIPAPPFSIGDMSLVSYTWEGGTGTLSGGSGRVPQGANVTFIAPSIPEGYPFYGYEWKGTGGLYKFESIRTNNTFPFPVEGSDIAVTLELVQGFEVDFDLVSPVSGGSITATGVYDGSSKTVNPGDVLRKGTEVTFTVAAPGGFNLYDIEWSVNGTLIKRQRQEGHLGPIIPEPFEHTVDGTTVVEAKLIQGHYVRFNGPLPNDAGYITAKLDPNGENLTIDESGLLFKAGSAITFTAHNPIGVEVFAYNWIVEGLGLPSPSPITDTYPIVSLISDLDVNVGFDPGNSITFGVGGGEGAIGAVADMVPPEFSPITSGTVVLDGTTAIFTATPAAPGSSEYFNRVAYWVVSVEGVVQTSGYTINGNELEMEITKPTDVRVFFERVTLELDPTTVTVNRHGDFNVAVKLTGDLTENPIPPVGLISLERGTLPTGLTIPNPSGTTITISSDYRLTHESNTDISEGRPPLTITVTLDGLTKTFEIIISLPIMEIEYRDPEDSDIEVTITNGKPTGWFVLHTDADDEPAFDINLPVALAGKISFTPPASLFGETNRYRIDISSDRLNLTEPLIFDDYVLVTQGGMSTRLKLNIRLTPPPRIDSITPTPATVTAFNNLRVHGTPPGERGVLPGPINAIFNISGASLNQEAPQDVARWILLNSFPAWITVDMANGVVSNITATSATFTVPITVSPNWSGSEGYDPEEAKDRSGNVVFGINLTVLPTPPTPPGHDHNTIKGTLVVSQYGPITLSSYDELIWNYRQEAEVRVTGGSGDVDFDIVDIDLDDYDGDVLPEELDVRIINTGGIYTIEIEGARPKTLDIISGKFTIRVTRDGISADIVVTVILTALDIPVVTWPSGFNATYGDYLSSVDINAENVTPGYARVQKMENYVTTWVDVPGTFTWTVLVDDPTNTTLVGNAGKVHHSMTFTPDDSENIATVVTPFEENPNPEINVAKATPTIASLPTVTLTYGQTFSQATITGGSAVYSRGPVFGAFTLDNTSYSPTVPEAGGDATFLMTFTPTDGANFNVVEGIEVKIVVNKADQLPPPAPQPLQPDNVGIEPIRITLENITNHNPTPNPPPTQFLKWDSTDPPSAIDWDEAIAEGKVLTFPAPLTFGGLIPFTDYHFFARYPGDDNHNPSISSPVGTIKTLTAPMGGIPIITGSPIYREIISVDTSDVFSDPPGDNVDGRDVARQFTFSFQWFRHNTDGTTMIQNIPGEAGRTYQLGPDDIDATITVIVSAINANNTLDTEVVWRHFGPILRRQPVLEDLEYSFTPSILTSFIGAETPINYTGEFNRNPHLVTVKPAAERYQMGSITVQYRLSDSTNEADWLTTVPTNIGEYKARVVMADDGVRYLPATLPLTGSFEITAAAPTALDLSATLHPPNDPSIELSTDTLVTIEWENDFLTTPPYAQVVPAATVQGLLQSQISVYYIIDGGEPSTELLRLPGTVDVFVNITAGGNFSERLGLYVGSYEIEEIEIDWEDDLYISNTNVTYDGLAKRVAVTDIAMGGNVYLSESATGPWTLANDFGLIDATMTPVTIFFKVERSGTGYETYYSNASNSPTLTINPRQLVWDRGDASKLAQVQDRQYNGGTIATGDADLAPTLLEGGPNGIATRADGIKDTVTPTPQTINFSQSNASDVPLGVSTTRWGITGTHSVNYIAPLLPPEFANARISKRQLTWNIGSDTNRAQVQNKPYDGTTTATDMLREPELSRGGTDGVVSGDTVTVMPGQLNFSQAGMGTDLVVTATGWDIDVASKLNYELLDQPLFERASITGAELEWDIGSSDTPAQAQSRPYDGTTTATPTTAGMPTLKDIDPERDGVYVVPGNLDFEQANVGEDLEVTATGWTIGGDNAGNYTAPSSQPEFATADITRRQLEWNIGHEDNKATVEDREYNREYGATIDSTPILKEGGTNGIVAGDDITLRPPGGVANFAQRDAGENIGVIASGWIIEGDLEHLANYTLPGQPLFENATILKRQLHWTIGSSTTPARVREKEYDGNNTADIDPEYYPTLSTTGINGIISPDVVTIKPGGLVSFTQIDAGGSVGVTASGWDIEGADVRNYTLSAQPLFANQAITAFRLTWAIGSLETPATAGHKVYDGTETATFTGAGVQKPTLNLSGVLPADIGLISVSEGDTNFSDRHADTGKAVTATGWGITVTGPANYLPPANQPIFNLANITPRPLTWDIGSVANLARVQNKPYDGTTTATVITRAPTLSVAPSLTGLLSIDTVTINPGSVNFSQSNKGENLTVTATGYGIAGANAGNYSLPTGPAGQPLFAPADITPIQLTWATGSTATRATAAHKVFDGNSTVLEITNPPTLSGVRTADLLLVSPKEGDTNFSDRNAATGKTVTATNWGIEGTGAVNYLPPSNQPLFNPANITPRPLMWSVGSDSNKAEVEHKYYDKTPAATVKEAPNAPAFMTGGTNGVVSPDVATVAPGSVNFAQSNAEDDLIVTATGWGIAGANASNYSLPDQPLFKNANIMRRPINTALVSVSEPYTYLNWEIVPYSYNVRVDLVPFESPLAPTTDFVVIAASNNIDSTVVGGLSIVTVEGRGNFTGTATGTFSIQQRPITGSVSIDAGISSIATGTVLTADVSSITGVPYGDGATSGTDVSLLYQWFRGTEQIATGSTYIVSIADAPGTSITVRVTGTGNYTDYRNSTPIIVGLTPIGGGITIDYDTLTIGSILTLNDNALTPSGATYTITWLRDDEIIPGETGGTYTLRQEDYGKIIRVEIDGTHPFTGSRSAYVRIPAIGPNPPQLPFTATPGDTIVTLTWLEPDFDGGSPITMYQVSVDGGPWIDTGSTNTTFTVEGLANDVEYTFEVRAVNNAEGVEHFSEPIETSAMPLATPIILSIEPTPETIEEFRLVPSDGFTRQAVFEVTGSNFSERAFTVYPFLITQLPAWIQSKDLTVEVIDSENAIVTVTLTVRRNSDSARSGRVILGVPSINSTTGTLSVRQERSSGSSGFRVTIINSPDNGTIPVGQSASVRVFVPGSNVPLEAGNSNGYSFIGWSSGSQGVELGSASNGSTSFFMPRNDVVIVANWGQIEEPPPETPPDPDPDSEIDIEDDPDTDDNDDTDDEAQDDDRTDPGTELGNGSGTGSGTGTTSGSGDGEGLYTGSTDTSRSRMGFWEWLRENTWWIWAYLTALMGFAFWWFILLWRKRKKKEEEEDLIEPPGGAGQHVPAPGST